MIKIISVAAPKDAPSKYQFFKDEATGDFWKASIIIKIAKPVMLSQAEVEVAPAELAVTVTVSPVDENGKALREKDMVIIIEPHTHTFSSAEMAEEDFDPSAIIQRIVERRIEAGKARIAAFKKINDAVEDWNKGSNDGSDPTPDTL